MTPSRALAKTLVEQALAGGPRVLHIARERSPVPIQLAQEHDREVEVVRWPGVATATVAGDSPWALQTDDAEDWSELADGAEDTIESWVRPFLVAPVDVVVVEKVLDDVRDVDAFVRALASGALVPGGLVLVAGTRDVAETLTANGLVVETTDPDTDTPTDGLHVTTARFPSFTTAQPEPGIGDEATRAESKRLARELERTREQLARERATLAREMQLGKDELLAMDRQVAELQDRLQRLRHKNVLLRARVAQVSRERELVQEQVAQLEEELFLARDSRAVRAVTNVVEKARRRREPS